MVQVRIDIVDTNGVDAQELHKGSVSETTIFVGQRIGGKVVASTATRLIGDAHDLVSITSGIVDEVISLDVNGGNGSSQRGSADKTEEGLAKL